MIFPEGGDCVVIGSGPGGAITACLLAEAGRKVCLIEEGVSKETDPFGIDEMESKYRNGGLTVAFGKSKINYVEGCCVGGGSEINSGLYHRLPTEVQEAWRQDFEIDHFQNMDLGTHYEAIESELSVSYNPNQHSTSEILMNGAKKLGWKATEVPRWVKNGKKQSMSKTYIPRFIKAGGKLVDKAKAIRLKRDGEFWEILLSKGKIKAKSVFVSCGTIHTAFLLHRSGICNNIGTRFQLHPTLKYVAEFPNQINSASFGVGTHQVKEFSPKISFGASISSAPYLALAIPDHRLSESWENMGIYYSMIMPEGVGRISKLPLFKDPFVTYKLTENDYNDLVKGAKNLAQLLFEAGAVSLYATFIKGGKLGKDQFQQFEDLIDINSMNLMSIHLFSSAPMGENKSISAVNSFGNVHNIPDLYVADGSVLCGAPSVNPQGTIMAICRRNIKHFLEVSK